MKIGIGFKRSHPALWEEVALEAERLGFESIWLSDHTVWPLSIAGSPFVNTYARHPELTASVHEENDCDYCQARAGIMAEVRPTVPLFDVISYLSYLAGRTKTIRLGTWVYILAVRHPLVAARAVQTLDIVSCGRLELGIGTGWVSSEWEALGVDFRTRGKRLDEAIEVCQRLWREEVVEHHGEFFDVSPVAFEPKPVQRPSPPLHIGGESPAALRRAARVGDGWIGMTHTPASARTMVRELTRLREEEGTLQRPFTVTVDGQIRSAEEIREWEDTGVDRLIVTPWRRSREALMSLSTLADLIFSRT